MTSENPPKIRSISIDAETMEELLNTFKELCGYEVMVFLSTLPDNPLTELVQKRLMCFAYCYSLQLRIEEGNEEKLHRCGEFMEFLFSEYQKCKESGELEKFKRMALEDIE